MRYTIKLHTAVTAELAAHPGRVDFNGQDLAPHEAAILADALLECAQSAEKLAQAQVYAAKYAAKSCAAH